MEKLSFFNANIDSLRGFWVSDGIEKWRWWELVRREEALGNYSNSVRSANEIRIELNGVNWKGSSVRERGLGTGTKSYFPGKWKSNRGLQLITKPRIWKRVVVHVEIDNNACLSSTENASSKFNSLEHFIIIPSIGFGLIFFFSEIKHLSLFKAFKVGSNCIRNIPCIILINY